MEECDVKKAVLFADVVGSTELYSKLGDQKAQALIQEALVLLKDIALQNFGTIIKEIGDAVMVTFDEARAACDAAQFMVQYMAQTLFDEEGTKLKVRISCHYGPVILKDGDVFGNTVNLAARILEYTKPSQILATHELLDALGDNLPSTRLYSSLEFKGIHGEQKIHEIIVSTEESEITMASIDIVRPDGLLKTTQITLNFGSQTFLVNADKPQITFGRQSSNDVVVDSEQVSRQHAMVQYQNGKFYLVDQSFNGTTVRFDNSYDAICVHQGDLVLHCNGAIIFYKDKEAIEIPFMLGVV